MKLTLRERSECFRGFLLLIAQDQVVSPEEKEMLRRIGKALDFEQRFCEEAMNDLLENIHIAKTPPSFPTLNMQRHSCATASGSRRQTRRSTLKRWRGSSRLRKQTGSAHHG